MISYATPSIHGRVLTKIVRPTALVRLRASLLGALLLLFASVSVELPSECIVIALLWIARLAGVVDAKKKALWRAPPKHVRKTGEIETSLELLRVVVGRALRPTGVPKVSLRLPGCVDC